MNAPEGDGWRAKLPPEARPRVVRRIADALMRLLPISAPEGLGELNNIASRFEEKVFHTATSPSDYVRRISRKMVAMERNHPCTNRNSVIPSQNSLDTANVPTSQMQPLMVMPHVLASMTGLNQSAISHTGQTSNMQAMKSIVLQQSQSRQQHASEQQLQFGQHISISKSQQQHPRLSNKQSGLLNMQWSQQMLIQQNSSMHPQHRAISSQSNTNVQHRTNELGLQHQNQLLNSHSTAQLLQQEKIPGQVLQTSSATLQMPRRQSSPQKHMSQLQPHSLHMQQQLPVSNELADKLYADLLEKRPALVAFLQPKNRIKQQKHPLQTQRALPETPPTSVDSTAQTTHIGNDVQEEIYQKIKSWKDMYFTDLRAMHERLTSKLQQHEGRMLPPGELSERLENLRKFTVSIWCLMQFLQLPKSNIHPGLKDKLPHYERQIIALVSSGKKRTPQGQHFQHTGVIDQFVQQQQQQPDVLRNLVQDMNVQTSVSTVQFTTDSSLENRPIPKTKQASAYSNLQYMVNALQPCSNMGSLQQGAIGSLQQSNLGTLHQASINIQQSNCINASTQNPVNALQSTVQQQLSNVLHHQHINKNLQAHSPLMLHHSSSLVEQQALAKIVPSPFTPSAPCGSSLSNTGDHGCLLSIPGQAQVQSLSVGAPGVSTSPLMADLDGSQPNLSTVLSGRGSSTERPLECLLKAVNSSSSSVIRSSVSGISSVASMIDRIAGVAPGDGSQAVVCEDLVAMTEYRLQNRKFIALDSSATTRNMKRKISGMPLNALPSAETDTIDTCELESTGTSNLKRRKMEASHALHDEIRDINNQLIDTVLDVVDDDVDSVSESREGTVVKCTFCAVALSHNLKSRLASAGLLPILPIRLLIPTKYLLCSPVLLDKIHMDHNNGECRDLSAKARSRFAFSIRGLPEKMSLNDMARTWDVSVREVILEYAQQNGGGSFTSKYGAWGNCAGS